MTSPVVPRDISRGKIFWRDAENQTVNTAGRPHHWVFLTDRVTDKEGRELVVWVPLTTHQPWIDAETYVFNVGKKNKYIDAKQTSCPYLKLAEIVAVDKIVDENPKRQHEIEEKHVVGICEALLVSDDTQEDVRDFYLEHGPDVNSPSE